MIPALRFLTVVAVGGVCLLYGVPARGQDTAPRFVLSGVVFNSAGDGIVWLQEPVQTQNKVVSAKVGDTVGAYRVTKIDDNRAELEGPNGPVVVRLYSAPTAGREATEGATHGSAQQPASQPAQGVALGTQGAPARRPVPGAGGGSGLVPRQLSRYMRNQQTPGTVPTQPTADPAGVQQGDTTVGVAPDANPLRSGARANSDAVQPKNPRGGFGSIFQRR